MTSTTRSLEFRILGPLEVRVGDDALPLGGAKQRAVLAVLLLHADDLVSVERLIEEVWGDNPPPSAPHSLEAYVSRLRHVLSGHGTSLVRRGAGYSLELAEAALDSRRFEELRTQAGLAYSICDYRQAAALAAGAAALWRRPALPDVSLATPGRSAAERLEEHRLRTLELRFDSELELGLHAELVGELQALVSQNSYREHFVAQLMLALYRSGRQAEALDVYERTRAKLAEDLGLRPSQELQQLSGQIVRQEPQLETTSVAAPSAGEPRRARGRIRRVAGLLAAGAVVAATMALTASGSAPHKTIATVEASGATRVALLLPRQPDASVADPQIRDTASALRKAAVAWGYEPEILVSADLEPAQEDVDRVIRQLATGRFGLVLVVGDGATARAVASVVRRLPGTRFVFVDASLVSLSLAGIPNATGVPFADYQTSQLAGYVSGLVPPQAGGPTKRADVVSVVASRRTPRVDRIVREFTRGARRALPDVTVLVDFTEDERDKTTCERLANGQVDAGSDLIYAVAGECSGPALAVAKLRGVWGIRANDDGVPDGPQILATTYKRWDQAVTEIVNGFSFDTLPVGRDRALTLADDYAVDMWGEDSPEVSAAWSKVVRLCSRLREHSETFAS